MCTIPTLSLSFPIPTEASSSTTARFIMFMYEPLIRAQLSSAVAAAAILAASALYSSRCYALSLTFCTRISFFFFLLEQCSLYSNALLGVITSIVSVCSRECSILFFFFNLIFFCCLFKIQIALCTFSCLTMSSDDMKRHSVPIQKSEFLVAYLRHVKFDIAS